MHLDGLRLIAVGGGAHDLQDGEAGGAASGTEAYYSFDYGTAHFIILDSMDSDRSTLSPMLQWLQDDLNNIPSTTNWIIASWHHPPYTRGSHHSDKPADSEGRMIDMRENVLPILEAAGVDLVISGHSHVYERSYFIHGVYGEEIYTNYDQIYEQQIDTPSFQILRNKGRILNAGIGNPPYEKTSVNGTVYVVAFGSCLLTINGNELRLENILHNGRVADTVVIRKSMMP